MREISGNNYFLNKTFFLFVNDVSLSFFDYERDMEALTFTLQNIFKYSCNITYYMNTLAHPYHSPPPRGTAVIQIYYDA